MLVGPLVVQMTVYLPLKSLRARYNIIGALTRSVLFTYLYTGLEAP